MKLVVGLICLLVTLAPSSPAQTPVAELAVTLFGPGAWQQAKPPGNWVSLPQHRAELRPAEQLWGLQPLQIVASLENNKVVRIDVLFAEGQTPTASATMAALFGELVKFCGKTPTVMPAQAPARRVFQSAGVG